MQCADIYFLKADICQLGLDQRKVNILAREYHSHLYRSQKKTKPIVPYRNKPVIISHHMLLGLNEGQEKMSKSDPDSAIFMEDSQQDINRKIKRAFCRPQEVQGNPIVDYIKHIAFPYLKLENKPFVIEKQKYSNFEETRTYNDYISFEKDYLDGVLHPSEIKPALTREINRLLEPIREHFKTNKKAKDLLNQVKKFKVTK